MSTIDVNHPVQSNPYWTSTRPVANQYLAEFWDRKAHQKHRNRLVDMKPAVDNSKPREYAHLMGKTGKKAMLAKDRQAKIDHDNANLMARMQGQANKNSSLTGTPVRHLPSTRGERSRSYAQHEIERANLALLARLESQVPFHTREQFMKDEAQHKEWIRVHRKGAQRTKEHAETALPAIRTPVAVTAEQ